MGVRFVIGRAGSGKTTRCFRAIVDSLRADPLGPPIYWLLPKQATFSAERQLTCSSGLNGFCRVRVLSFESLSDEILSECGGCAIPRVDALGRQMLIGHLLRTRHSQLRFFGGVARQPGLAARLDATFGELERTGQDASTLTAVVADLDHSSGGDPHLALLRDKLSDVNLLYSAYRTFIGQERLDPHARMTEMLSCIDRCQSLRGAHVFVDSFHEFTGNERQTLAALARVAQRLEITLTLDPMNPILREGHTLPHALSLFHPTEQTYRRLWLTFQQAGVAVESPILLKDTHRFCSPALKAIEQRLFDHRSPSVATVNGVSMIVAADRRTEVDAAARHIRQVLGRGQRLRGVAVLVRDLDEYQELIDASFREHGLPWFVDRRRTAAHHPLVQLIRSLLAIARQGWPHDAVIALLKSGLAGLSLDEADELENYVLQHRIQGAGWTEPDAWTYARRSMRQDEDDENRPSTQCIEPDRMDGLRRGIVDRIGSFVAPGRWREPENVRRTIGDLYRVLQALDVPTTIMKWMEQANSSADFEQRDEHAQVWDEMVALFDQMTDLVGDESLTLEDFAEVLETGLEQFDLAITPATVDQVLVGQVDRTRTPPGLHTVIVMGLSEGQFPRASREDSVLADEERRTLLERPSKLEIDPGSERRLLDENFLGYLAFTRAARDLVVTRPMAGADGRPISASQFWHRLERLFPSISPTIIERGTERDWENIGTPRQLVTSLVRWVRETDAYRPLLAREGETDIAGRHQGASINAREEASAAPTAPVLSRGETEPADDPRPALYSWLVQHELCDDAIDTMRRRAWRALSYQNSARISPGTAARLFRSPLKASVTRFESFATCPFKHFARFGLRLEERQEQDVTAMDLGNVYHQILERIVRDLLASRCDWPAMDAMQTDEAVRLYAQEIGQSLRGELMLSSARNKYLLSRIEQTLSRVIAAQQAVLSRGGFRPAAAEVEFGLSSEHSLPPLEITTPAGHTVLLRGKIDRVDVLADRAEFAVIDYKLGHRALSLASVYHGLSLQLLTYLLVLQANGKKLLGRPMTPAAAFYVQLLRKLESVSHPDDAIDPGDPLFNLQVKPRGLLDARVVPNLDASCSGGASEVVQVYLNKDGNFGRLDSSDVAPEQGFNALLAHVRVKIGELADQLVGGDIEARPYRIGKVTPCPQCEYRSVCRFEPGVNRYHSLQRMKRSEVLETLVNPGGNDGA